GRLCLLNSVDGCWVWSPGFSRSELAYCRVARNFFTRAEPRTLCRLKAGLQTFHRSVAPNKHVRPSPPSNAGFIESTLGDDAVGTSIPEVHKTQRDRKIVGADRRNHRLQIVPVLSAHTDFLALDLGCDLEFKIPDEAGDLLSHDRFNPLFDLDDLTGVAELRDIRFAFVHVLQTDLALGELA